MIIQPKIDEVRAAFEAWNELPHTMADLSPEGVWQAAYAAGRRKGLEEASAKTMSMAEYLHKRTYADAIRSLIDKEAT